LVQFDPRSLVVTARESKHREFKLAFVANNLSDYTKTMAAFANADGGRILFGISKRSPDERSEIRGDVRELERPSRISLPLNPGYLLLSGTDVITSSDDGTNADGSSRDDTSSDDGTSADGSNGDDTSSALERLRRCRQVAPPEAAQLAPLAMLRRQQWK
jgi:hypothetical protein